MLFFVLTLVSFFSFFFVIFTFFVLLQAKRMVKRNDNKNSCFLNVREMRTIVRTYVRMFTQFFIIITALPIFFQKIINLNFLIVIDKLSY